MTLRNRTEKNSHGTIRQPQIRVLAALAKSKGGALTRSAISARDKVDQASLVEFSGKPTTGNFSCRC